MCACASVVFTVGSIFRSMCSCLVYDPAQENIRFPTTRGLAANKSCTGAGRTGRIDHRAAGRFLGGPPGARAPSQYVAACHSSVPRGSAHPRCEAAWSRRPPWRIQDPPRRQAAWLAWLPVAASTPGCFPRTLFRVMLAPVHSLCPPQFHQAVLQFHQAGLQDWQSLSASRMMCSD